MSSQLNDFHKQDVTFDINRLKEACDQVLKVKGFDTSLGIPHFASISLNQNLRFVCENHLTLRT